jgi:alcohol dehydrogenase (cytochrome c)
MAGLTRLAVPMAFAASAQAAGLDSPAGSEWPAVGGDWANSRYSTLSQIDAGNVGRLGGAWVHRFDGEHSRATPVVTAGRMFVTAGTHVYALDPRTGDTLWTATPDTPPFGLFKGVAAGDGKIFIGLMEGGMVALDQKTGAKVWQQTIVDQAAPGGQGGQWVSGSPAYAEGLVIAGLAGARAPIDRNDGRVVALDAATGAVKWVFHVVPGPGEAGHETWPQDSDVWKRGGGAVWMTPAVDPALGLVYVGTGNPIPELGGEARPGDNLYTASVVALDLATGRLRWVYQTTHHDIYEQDLGTPMVLYDAEIGGKPRKAIAALRTDGYLFLLDRATGKPLLPVEERPVPQDAGQATAPTQPFPVGADQIGPNCVPKDAVPAGFVAGCYFDVIETGRPNLITPVATTRSSPMAYSPGTGFFYAAGSSAPLWLQRWDDPYVFSGDGAGGVPGVKSHGIVAAIDSRTDKIVWQKTVPYRIENGSGLTATAGGLVFHGEPDGYLQAIDAATGDLLWQFQTGADESGPVVSYAIDGQQYVAALASDRLWAFRLGGILPPDPAPPLPPTETSFRGKIEATDEIHMSADLTDGRAIVKVLHFTNEYAFKPQRAKVKAGTTVTWINDGKLAHNAGARDGSWSTGEIAPGAKSTIRFDTPGTYTYVCKDHPWSYGQLVVEP